MRADLHIHTHFSDGLLTPENVVALVKGAGPELFAVTDHDTVKGFDPTNAAAKKEGLICVLGAEISAYDRDVKVHTLGYNMDVNADCFKDFMRELYDGSVKRAEDIIFKLNKNGIALSFEEAVAERFAEDTPIHAMHIARAGAKKGYAKTAVDFYFKYLAYGTAAFSNICRPEPERTVEIICAAGGFCSLAHPGRIDMNKTDKEALIKRMKECGLSGIEAVYSTHTANETAYYKELAKGLGLLVTGGSDTHFTGGNRRIGKPYFEPSEELLQKLGL